LLQLECDFDRVKHLRAAWMTDELRSLQLRSLYEPAHRRSQLLLDEPWQRARGNDPEADGVDHPAHDVERARPRVFGGRADAHLCVGWTGAQYCRGAVAEQRLGDNVGL